MQHVARIVYTVIAIRSNSLFSSTHLHLLRICPQQRDLYLCFPFCFAFIVPIIMYLLSESRTQNKIFCDSKLQFVYIPIMHSGAVRPYFAGAFAAHAAFVNKLYRVSLWVVWIWWRWIVYARGIDVSIFKIIQFISRV